ncbi:GerAB/ArcD/ProY family transporter [Metabacillus arenae]|uniref:Endospore germination permease n=1 Tax=Metabacillus arenae TaxID=2771434 RepID=A0A926NDZ4_9BACI|nr:endospore germination permease [Metabacillus arenae]MBD1382507.1 endospore germination permease [Metabacillus arenae]
MKQTKISGLQLLYVMVGYQLGTAMILGIGPQAKQDAWAVVVIGMFSGLILMGVYVKLAAHYPDDTLVQIIPRIIGKYLSYPIIIMYIFHFTYSAARACRELGDLLTSSILISTPNVVVIGFFMVLMLYCLHGGVETFGRMGELVFPVYIFSLIVIWILLLTIEQFDFNNLSPILGNGVKPVLQEAFPQNINFPFGETIIFMMFFPFLKSKGKVMQLSMTGILIGGMLLTVNSIMMISTLGPEIYKKEFFLLLSAARMVSIADFLERFDALVILLMVTGVFLKVGGFTFGAAVAITQLFKLTSPIVILLPLFTIITPLALISGTSYVEHLEIGTKIFVPYFHTVLQIIIPVLLLCIAFIRKKFNLGNSR